MPDMHFVIKSIIVPSSACPLILQARNAMLHIHHARLPSAWLTDHKMPWLNVVISSPNNERFKLTPPAYFVSVHSSMILCLMSFGGRPEMIVTQYIARATK